MDNESTTYWELHTQSSSDGKIYGFKFIRNDENSKC